MYDIPREVKLSTTDEEEAVIRFVYPDREEAAETETLLDDNPDTLVRRGRYSGKLMALRTRPVKNFVPTLAERLKIVAPRQKRKNQELNFLLLSNILRKKQDELLSV